MRNSGSCFLKGIGLGAAVGMAAALCVCKYSGGCKGAKRRLKTAAGTISDLFDNLSCMIK